MDVSALRCEVASMEKFLNVEGKRYSKIYIKLTSFGTSDSAHVHHGDQNDELTTHNADDSKLHLDALRLTHNNKRRQAATSASRARLLIPLHHQPSASSIATSSSFNSNKTTDLSDQSDQMLLYKLRRLFFRRLLPVHNASVASIVERAWRAKLDTRMFESQNGLRLLVAIRDVRHYLTTTSLLDNHKNEDESDSGEVFGFAYTIAINGQDPEFMGIGEPTYADYVRETTRQQSDTNNIEFVASNANELDLLYIRTTTSSSISEQPLSRQLNSMLERVWTDLNSGNGNEDKTQEAAAAIGRSTMKRSRIMSKIKLTPGFYDADELIARHRGKKHTTAPPPRVSRLAISWLVDGSAPNPLYFHRPGVLDLAPYFSALSSASNTSTSIIEMFSGTPMIAQSIGDIDLSSLLVLLQASAPNTYSNNTSSSKGGDQVLSALVAKVRDAVRQAWLSANPKLADSVLHILVDQQALVDTKARAASVWSNKHQQASNETTQLTPTLTPALGGLNLTYFVGVRRKRSTAEIESGFFDVADLVKPSAGQVRDALKRSVPALAWLRNAELLSQAVVANAGGFSDLAVGIHDDDTNARLPAVKHANAQQPGAADEVINVSNISLNTKMFSKSLLFNSKYVISIPFKTNVAFTIGIVVAALFSITLVTLIVSVAFRRYVSFRFNYCRNFLMNYLFCFSLRVESQQWPPLEE